MKGLGGAIVDLGGGRTGFLRGPRLPAPGRPLLVQVGGWAEPGKAPPVNARLLLKGRTAILTPGAPGLNIARSLRDPDRRADLDALVPAGDGRRRSGDRPDPALGRRGDRRRHHRGRDRRVARRARGDLGPDGAPGLVRAAPGAAAEALREWRTDDASVRDAATALADAGVWEDIAALRRPDVTLGQGSMAIEPTRALVAVDVNTGADLSPAAALKVNLAAAAELPRQLRLRGLGGQVTIDFAPLSRSDRVQIERTLARALRDDGIDTTLAGWSPLGHLELQRKRARRPL